MRKTSKARGTPRIHDALMRSCRTAPPLLTAVVHPCDVPSLTGALRAAESGIITPTLVGPAHRIKAAAASAGLDLSPYEIIDVPHSHAAAAYGVDMARSARVEAIMKGSLHSDELMAEVVRKEGGLRTGRRITHAFVLDLPSRNKPLLITDAVVNIAPNLEQKADIVQNVADLAHALGISRPKIALLSAVETVTSRIPSTIDAAALCKMADRGQIVGATLDGPLALDNAVSRDAARVKHIDSRVAGDADAVVVPNMEAGNLLAKELIFIGGADAAGVVLGAAVPIILTSRADSVRTRTASCALAAIYRKYRTALSATALRGAS